MKIHDEICYFHTLSFLSVYRFTFDGSVKVTLAVSKETSMIILHIRDIKVNETSVIVKDSSNAVVSHGIIEYDLDREFIKVPTTKPLSEGE